MEKLKTVLLLAAYCAGCCEIQPKISFREKDVAIYCDRAHSCSQLAARIKATQCAAVNPACELNQTQQSNADAQ